jgi:predicted MFS family arabinose efflux permease
MRVKSFILYLSCSRTYLHCPTFTYTGYLGWRFPFVIMGMYAFLSAALVYVTLKEPQRGAKEEDLTEVLSKGIHTYSLTLVLF